MTAQKRGKTPEAFSPVGFIDAILDSKKRFRSQNKKRPRNLAYVFFFGPSSGGSSGFLFRGHSRETPDASR